MLIWLCPPTLYPHTLLLHKHRKLHSPTGLSKWTCVNAQLSVDKLSLILTAVFLDTFYSCHFHSTACAKRFAFICHITVFFFNHLSSPAPSLSPLFTPSSSPSGFYCTVLCLTSQIKFPHVIKLHFSKEQQPPKPLRPLFLFSPSFFFFFSHQALSALPSLLGFAARLASPLTDLWRFVEFAKIKKESKKGQRRQPSGVPCFHGREMQNELHSENTSSG